MPTIDNYDIDDSFLFDDPTIETPGNHSDSDYIPSETDTDQNTDEFFSGNEDVFILVTSLQHQKVNTTMIPLVTLLYQSRK